MIVILCPTRDRKPQYKRMLKSCIDTSENVAVVSGTNGGKSYVGTNYPIDIPTVFMWNDLAKKAMKHPDANLFMLGSDDIVFSTPHWDKAILDHYNALEEKVHVYSLRDSRDPLGTPHPIVTREYVNAMGYFIPPIFLHWFVDTWTVEIAKANHCFTHLSDYLLVHDKPSDTGQADETHNKIRRMGWHARDKMVADTCPHLLSEEKDRLNMVLGKKRNERYKAAHL